MNARLDPLILFDLLDDIAEGKAGERMLISQS